MVDISSTDAKCRNRKLVGISGSCNDAHGPLGGILDEPFCVGYFEHCCSVRSHGSDMIFRH